MVKRGSTPSLVRFMCPAGEIIGSDFPPACLDRGDWTVWFDRSNPTGSDGSDVELISQIRHERPGELCEKPLYMQGNCLTPLIFLIIDFETVRLLEKLNF